MSVMVGFDAVFKRVLAAMTILFACQSYVGAQGPVGEPVSSIFERGQTKVYVVAHRGDWRDAPENSIEALKRASALGVDVVEIDLKKTRDGQLVVMHDQTLDRTTTGSGPVSGHSLGELKSLRLRAGTGHPTAHQIPTFAEEIAAAQNNTIIDVDQGWSYFSDVVKQVRAAHAVGQVIVNVLPNTSYENFTEHQGPIPEDLTVMLVVDMSRPDAEGIIRSYKVHERTIIQCIFGNDELTTVQHIPLYRQSSPVWINSLWPEQNGGHDDDRAVDQRQQDQSWGWLISHGANILQTDRPRELIEYLRQKNLHR